MTSLVGGMAAERWGPRYVVLISSAASGILTAFSPAAARAHYLVLVVDRFLLGFAGVSVLRIQSYQLMKVYQINSTFGGIFEQNV